MIHSPFVTSLFIWIGIAFCIIQSAIFSGLNLAIFSVSKLRLEVEAAGGNRDAISLLGLRKDSNLTLSTSCKEPLQSTVKQMTVKDTSTALVAVLAPKCADNLRSASLVT
jgi:CBS domain containing-hemolysin-like protein